MSPFAKQLHSYYTSFGSSLAPEALSNFLKGKRVFFLGYSREISSLLSFMGGAGIHFGGPARGEDYGDTWKRSRNRMGGLSSNPRPRTSRPVLRTSEDGCSPSCAPSGAYQGLENPVPVSVFWPI